MSNVSLVVREAKGDWSGRVPTDLGQQAIAALSADPVTLAELDVAMLRFVEPGSQGPLLSDLTPGMRDATHDDGLIVVDLAARLVIDTTDPDPQPFGALCFFDGHREICLRYRLADEWLVLGSGESWRSLADERRRERAACLPRDNRAVFYGRPLMEFIAHEVFAAFGQRETMVADLRARLTQQLNQPVTVEHHDRKREEHAGATIDRTELNQLSDKEILERRWPSLGGDDRPVHTLLKEIHAKWLMNPRPELSCLSPREVALQSKEHITWSLQHRCEQWSILGECPRGLDDSSFAYQYAGFGTHELVLYYELVRELLWSSWNQLDKLIAPQLTSERPTLSVDEFIAGEVPRLEQFREDWLDTPDPESHFRTSRAIIHRERARIPEVISSREAMVDPDCPCCQMMADLPGPVFWHLDDCNMDEEFAFDISHQTREEWEDEQRKWDEYNEQFASTLREEERLGLERSAFGIEEGSSFWSASYGSGDMGGEEEPSGVRIFGIGCHLAKLITSLRGGSDRTETPPDIQQLIDLLNRNFGNLRDLFQGESSASFEALLQPVLDHFIDVLEQVSRRHPELTPKCEELTRQLNRLCPEGSP